MKFYSLALIFFATVFGFTAAAQSFENMPETRRGKHPFTDFNWELYVRRTQVFPKYTPEYGGTTFNAKFRFEDYVKGGRRWHFENPTLGDMFWVVGRLIKGKKTEQDDGSDQAFGSGFFGWHQITWNAVATDDFLVSPGLSIGDYIFSTQKAGGVITDPAGYFFYAGPAVMVTKLFSDSFWVNAYTRYDITTRAGKPSANYAPADGAKNPHFFAIGASVQHGKSHLCGGINYTTLIDRGPADDAASRVDISIGFMF